METIVTSEPEKLPESVRALVDETRPLPPGVSFFEERYTTATFLKRIVIGLVLLLIAVMLILFSLEFLYDYDRHIDPKYREYFNFKAFAIGVVFAFGGWMMISSVRAGWALMRRQTAGERTRHGIFLVPETLVCQSQFHTTVIPRENFRGLNGSNVNYILKEGGDPKSFRLPSEWVGVAPAEALQAITRWEQSGPSVAPPLPPPSV